MFIANLAIFVSAAYLVLFAFIYLAQSWLIFPSSLVSRASRQLPSGASLFTIGTPDGETLAAVRLPATQEATDKPILLGFGGNRWNAQSMAVQLHRFVPDHDVVVAFYRGYRQAVAGRAPMASWVMP